MPQHSQDIVLYVGKPILSPQTILHKFENDSVFAKMSCGERSILLRLEFFWTRKYTCVRIRHLEDKGAIFVVGYCVTHEFHAV